ncbi:MAG: ACT domain-containing protein [Terriglobales bacterium]
MPRVKQLTAWTENRPGRLAEAAAALGEKKINILALWAGVAGDRWAIRMIVDKPQLAKKHLEQKGWEITEEDVVRVSLPDKPGSLGRAARKLEAAGINIEYGYTSRGKTAGKIDNYFALTDVAAALKALR